jgi:hypothetical protein
MIKTSMEDIMEFKRSIVTICMAIIFIFSYQLRCHAVNWVCASKGDKCIYYIDMDSIQKEKDNRDITVKAVNIDNSFEILLIQFNIKAKTWKNQSISKYDNNGKIRYGDLQNDYEVKSGVIINDTFMEHLFLTAMKYSK